MQHLLLLHGAIGAKDQLQPLATHLEGSFLIHTLNFSGHGGTPFPAEPFSIPLFARDVLNYLDEQELENCAIFGYSMGGYVGMYLARHYPEKISRLITLGTKYAWDETTAAKQQKMFHAAGIQEKAPALAAQLKELHAPEDWEMVLQQTAAMLLIMGKNNPVTSADMEQVQMPVLLLQGDRDKMVPLEEVIAVYKKLPAAQLGILPATPHPLEQVNIPHLSFVIKQFLL